MYLFRLNLSIRWHHIFVQALLKESSMLSPLISVAKHGSKVFSTQSGQKVSPDFLCNGLASHTSS